MTSREASTYARAIASLLTPNQVASATTSVRSRVRPISLGASRWHEQGGSEPVGLGFDPPSPVPFFLIDEVKVSKLTLETMIWLGPMGRYQPMSKLVSE